MSPLIEVKTADAPQAIGPYSQGIAVDNYVYVSGCLPLDPKTGEVVPGGVKAQAERALNNFGAIVKAGGSNIDQVIKTTLYLKNVADFAEVNAVYEKFFGSHKPARAIAGGIAIPKDVLIEIEGIARKVE